MHEARPKLTEAEVIEIRRLAEQGTLTHIEIAERFSVSQSLISMIKLRQLWKHI